MPNPLYITNPRNSYLNNLPNPVAMAFAVEFVVFSTGAEVVEVDDTSTAPAEPLVIFAPSIIPLYELSSVPKVAAVCEIELNCCNCSPVALFESDEVINQCPDCGKYRVRPANETEIAEYEARALEDDNE